MRSMKDCFWNLFFHLDCPFNSLHFCFSFCIIIYILVCQYSFSYYWYCYSKNQLSGAVLKKRCSYKFHKIEKKNTKKEILSQMFSCEFCEISHSIFFKESFGQLLHHEHSLCLPPHHDLSPIQKQCRTHFLFSA